MVVNPSDNEIVVGNLQPAQLRLSWLVWPFAVLGLFLVVWYGFLRRLIIRINRRRPNRIIPPEESAWAVFNKVYADAREYGGFGASYAGRIETALRKYLADATKMKIEALTVTEISNLMADDPRLPLIRSIFAKCDLVVYARTDQPGRLSGEQIKELYEQLSKLVPEPEE